MRVLISGVCGFVGARIAQHLVQSGCNVIGFDNLARQGSWVNFDLLRQRGVELRHADVRMKSDLEHLGAMDWIIDAAATPSVLAGVNNQTSSQQLLETNLMGTVNLLEICKQQQAGFILLSSSRVYSIAELQKIPLATSGQAFVLESSKEMPKGVTQNGISETFSTEAPISLYGASKLASEILAKEYSQAFEFPLWINRCGVLAGSGQFARADQGIFAFWLHRWRAKRDLRYIGFDGQGLQVRDCLHPLDLARLLYQQMQSTHTTDGTKPITLNVAGGITSARSLAQLSEWCRDRWGDHAVGSDLKHREYDVPWVILDSSLAKDAWSWVPEVSTPEILAEIAAHADENPDWLTITE